jgi:hypothetical protein
MGPLEESLPDELLVAALSFASARDLIDAQSTAKRLRNLDTDALWKTLCQHRWKDWPMYVNRSMESIPGSSWKDRYIWVEEDCARTELIIDELQRLEWNFNFLPWANRNPAGDTVSRCYFVGGRLYLLKYLWIYPRLDYEIVDDTTNIVDVGDNVMDEPLQAAAALARTSHPRCSQTQQVRVAHFPQHRVARTSQGGWLLWNENVVFFSDGRPDREEELPDQLKMHLEMFRMI